MGQRVTLFSGPTFVYDIGVLEWLKEFYVTLAAVMVNHADSRLAPALPAGS
jgi:hypothetical protein